MLRPDFKGKVVCKRWRKTKSKPLKNQSTNNIWLYWIQCTNLDWRKVWQFAVPIFRTDFNGMGVWTVDSRSRRYRKTIKITLTNGSIEHNTQIGLKLWLKKEEVALRKWNALKVNKYSAESLAKQQTRGKYSKIPTFAINIDTHRDDANWSTSKSTTNETAANKQRAPADSRQQAASQEGNTRGNLPTRTHTTDHRPPPPEKTRIFLRRTWYYRIDLKSNDGGDNSSGARIRVNVLKVRRDTSD